MRKTLCALMIPLLLLSGCGGEAKGDDAEQMALDARAQYLSMAGCTATLDITADYGERVFQCVLTLDHTAGGETVLTVVEPDLLTGVTARLKNGSSLLEFDGLSLDTGPVSPSGLSPLDCVPFLLGELQTGFISQWCLEEEGEARLLRFTTSDPDTPSGQGTEATLWLEAETFALRRGEVAVDGAAVLRCEVTDFTWKERDS